MLQNLRTNVSDFRKRVEPYVSHDIGIDLGTSNTVVYVRGKGIILNEPSVVAVNKKTGQVVDIGTGAKNMLGRTPSHIVAVKPLVGGVISDFEVAEEMLAYFIQRAQEASTKKIIAPRVVIGVPSGITNVEQRAVRDAAKNAGARDVVIVEEPLLAALGIGLPVYEPIGSMIIDLGGGTTDIAVVSMGGIVTAQNINVAGEKFNSDIITYIRDEFKILIGEKTAEELKLTVTAVMPLDEAKEMTVKGRDLASGLPREVVITDTDVREALLPSIDTLVKTIRHVLEDTPPEILSDVMQRGVHIVGGGALTPGLEEFLREWMKFPVYTADNPLAVVARGTGVILDDIETHKPIFVHDEHALPL